VEARGGVIADANENWKARHVKMRSADQRMVFAKEGSRQHAINERLPEAAVRT
jgi:hypothetical protein